jgi:outer membrane translocation and assembly module TamA
MERDAAESAAEFYHESPLFHEKPAQSWRSQSIKRFEDLQRLELDNTTKKEMSVLNNLMCAPSEQQNHTGGYVNCNLELAIESFSLSLSDWGYAFKMSKKTETLMHINPNPKTHTPDLRSCF